MTQAERTRMYAANCACCMLAASMRDCNNCLFRQEQAVTYRRILEMEALNKAYKEYDSGDEPEDWLCGTNYIAEHEDFLDLKRTEHYCF